MTRPASGTEQPVGGSGEQPPARPSGRRLAAGAGLVSAGRMLGSAFNLLIIVSLTRLLDPAVFGLVAMVYLIQETLNSIGTLGLPSALFYFVPKHGEGSARSLGLWTGGLLFALALPLALALWLGGPTIAEWADKPNLGPALGYLAVYLLADFPGQALPNFLLARQSYRAAFGVTVFFYGGRFLSLVVPAALGGSLETLMISFAGVALLRLLAFLGYFLLIHRGPLRRSGWSPGSLLAYGVPLSLSQIVGKLNVQVDKYMIAALCSAQVFAVYTVGAIEIPLVPSIAYSVTDALIPALVLLHERRDSRGFVGTWHASMGKVAAIMMPIFFFFLVLAPPAMRIFFSASYSDAAVPFRVYLLLLPLRLCSYGGVVRALGRTRPVLWASGAALLANVLLNYPLYRLLGLPGPALASVLAQVVAISVLLAAVRKELKVAWRRIFPVAPVAKALAVAGGAALPLLLVVQWLEGDVLQLAAGAAVYLPAYLGLGALTGLLGREDFDYLRDVVTLRILKRSARSGDEGAS